MIAADVIPCPGCGVNPIEHDPDTGAPEVCTSCQSLSERQDAAIYYARLQRAERAARNHPPHAAAESAKDLALFPR